MVNNPPPPVEELVRRLHGLDPGAAYEQVPEWIRSAYDQQELTTAAILGAGPTVLGLPVALQGLVRHVIQAGDRELFFELLRHTLLAPTIQPALHVVIRRQSVPSVELLPRLTVQPDLDSADLWSGHSPTAAVAQYVRAAIQQETQAWRSGVRTHPGPLVTLELAYRATEYVGWRYAPKVFKSLAAAWALEPVEATNVAVSRGLPPIELVEELVSTYSYSKLPGLAAAFGLVETHRALQWAASLVAPGEAGVAFQAWEELLREEMRGAERAFPRQAQEVNLPDAEGPVNLIRDAITGEANSQLDGTPELVWLRLVALPVLVEAVLNTELGGSEALKGALPRVISALSSRSTS